MTTLVTHGDTRIAGLVGPWDRYLRGAGTASAGDLDLSTTCRKGHDVRWVS